VLEKSFLEALKTLGLEPLLNFLLFFPLHKIKIYKKGISSKV